MDTSFSKKKIKKFSHIDKIWKWFVDCHSVRIDHSGNQHIKFGKAKNNQKASSCHL